MLRQPKDQRALGRGSTKNFWTYLATYGVDGYVDPDPNKYQKVPYSRKAWKVVGNYSAASPYQKCFLIPSILSCLRRPSTGRLLLLESSAVGILVAEI